MRSNEDIVSFRESPGVLLDNVSDGIIGHNLYLSRNGHDGSWEENDIDEHIRDRLQEICESFCEVSVYMYDNFTKLEIVYG